MPPHYGIGKYNLAGKQSIMTLAGEFYFALSQQVQKSEFIPIEKIFFGQRARNIPTMVMMAPVTIYELGSMPK